MGTERRPAGDGALKLVRFCLVGIGATLLHAAWVAAFSKSERLGFTPIQASLGAYAAATLFSYLVHKSLTFASGRSHQTEAPLFLLLAAAGLAVAYGAPALLTVKLGLPLIIPVLITHLLVPAINFSCLTGGFLQSAFPVRTAIAPARGNDFRWHPVETTPI